MNRLELRKYAHATDLAVEKGKVVLKDGTIHDFSSELAAAMDETTFYSRLDLENLHKFNRVHPVRDIPREKELNVVFKQKFIQDAVFESMSELPGRKFAVLNFASYKKPGGGWLNGAVAQEEAIARSSALVKVLEQKKCDQFYSQDKRLSKAEAENERCSLIFSKNVPFIRYRDEFCKPYYCSVITCAAVNVHAAKKYLTPEWTEHLMSQRIKHVLNVATEYGIDVLLLGSWGTGVFGNSVEMIARLFKTHLGENFRGCFEQVQFIIPDSPTMNEFREQFQRPVTPAYKDAPFESTCFCTPPYKGAPTESYCECPDSPKKQRKYKVAIPQTKPNAARRLTFDE